MLPWLALTYTAARLGFEAQNAAAVQLLRLAGGIPKTGADEIVPVPPGLSGFLCEAVSIMRARSAL